jgi:hypothetical protein
MPDGDKGGGFFALHGVLFQQMPCAPPSDLNLQIGTGQTWHVSGNGAAATGVPFVTTATTKSPAWANPIPNSSWISINPALGKPPGSPTNYTYTFEFCLCEEGLKTAALNAVLLADNCVISVTLNSTNVPPGSPLMPCPNGFTGGPYPYATTTGFVVGTNTVKVVVQNNGNITGLDALFKITAAHGACPRRIYPNGTTSTTTPANPN